MKAIALSSCPILLNGLSVGASLVRLSPSGSWSLVSGLKISGVFSSVVMVSLLAMGGNLLVLRRIDTLSEAWLATARSGLLSLLKSPILIPLGELPTPN
ncbi:MAG: hypothetical protein RIE73_06925 [Coleofasciculus sp. C1-SOL-03]